MPPAFKIALVISLFVVLASSRSSFRRESFGLALFAPLVITALIWLLNAFMADDYAIGWSWFVGGVMIYVPTAVICAVAVAVVFWWKGRRSRDANI